MLHGINVLTTYLELVSLTEDGAHVGDAVIADLADVQQATHTLAKINKCTIRFDRLNDALCYVTNLHQAELCHSEQYRHVFIHSAPPEDNWQYRDVHDVWCSLPLVADGLPINTV